MTLNNSHMSNHKLHIYNTLSRTKEEFKPINADHVNMYVCGPTVYDYAHLGNARPVIVFDILYRILQGLFPKVTYARNITDVDDKIIAKSQASKRSILDITTETTKIYQDDMRALNNLDPTIQPKATEHIKEMIALVETLLSKGFAYESDNHVLFDVTKSHNYGILSGRKLEDMIAGARVEVASYKKNAGDFILWKPSEKDIVGWDSPWGYGRPGWHLECSAMSEKYLGKTFDIHGGGHDLIFPHHENEIAQSHCANGSDTYAKYWMHNGHLMVEGEKMSKSLGNFITVHELLEDTKGEILRFLMLGTHYRKPIDWTKKNLQSAKKSLNGLYKTLNNHIEISSSILKEDLDPNLIDDKFFKALTNDLNTPLAMARLHELSNEINNSGNNLNRDLLTSFIASGKFIGLFSEDPALWFKVEVKESDLTDDEINNLISERTTAKSNRDFARSDEIRDLLKDNNISIKDTANGVEWHRV